MTDRRLIELALPLAQVSEHAAKDKASKKAHVRNFVLYWSCKPLPASRVVAYASIVPAPRSPDDLQDELAFVERLAAYGVEHNDSSVMREAARRVALAHPSGVQFHDPFSGSGAHAIEAQRLGAEVHASDLNPVAAFITNAVARLIPMASNVPAKRIVDGFRLDEEAELAAANVFRTAMARLRSAYSGAPRGEEQPFAYIWFRTAVCSNPACRQIVPLTASWNLSKSKGNEWSLEPSFDATGLTYQVREGESNRPATVSRSRIVCPWCESVSPNDYLQTEGMAGRIGHRLMAVAWQSPNGKRYRTPTPDEERAPSGAAADLSDITFPPFPQDDSRKFTPALFGVSEWKHVHTERQLLALVEFALAIRREVACVMQRCADLSNSDADLVVEAVAVVLSASLCRMADLLTSLCGWEPNAQAVRHLFTGKAVPMMWNYGEASPVASASGSWDLCFKRTMESVQQIPRPATIAARVSMSAAQDVVVGPIDIVVTDPPYYDAIAYAHLADFFVPWIRYAMGDKLPDWFSVTSTPKRREIIQRPSGEKTKDRFEADIAEALVRLHQNLADDGVVTLVYAHKSTAAWETLLDALLRSGFIVVATWPIETEMAARKDARGNASLASTVYFVCRKRTTHDDGFIDDVEPALKERLHERLDYFWSQGIRGADFFMSAIGPAVEVFGKHKRVLKLSGEEVTIAELLDTVRSIVADYALQRIVHGEAAGNVDEPSRFYVIWRWAFGTTEVESGEAIHMAQSMGCEFNELVADKGVLNKKGDKVNLKGPTDRKKVKGLGAPAATGTLAPLIDVLHRAANLWAAGERQELSDFLEEALPPGGTDRMQRLAQSIVDVLPPGDKERALYENFLVGARSLPVPTKKDETAEKQQRLF
jgi:adenine-specific DNA methylase